MTAIAVAFRSAWNLSNQISGLALAMERNHSAVKDELLKKIDDRADELRADVKDLESRLRKVENDLAGTKFHSAR